MIRILAPLVLVFAGIVWGISREATRDPADLVLVNRNEVSTLDPSQMSWQHDFRVARLVFEGLTRQDVLDPKLAIRPAVAESWVVSPDGLEYTFRIRAGAVWSTGEPVTARDFVAGWRRMMLPDAAADYLALFHLIEGAADFTRWRAQELAAFAKDPARRGDAKAAEALWKQTLAQFDDVVGVRAVDANTLRVRLVAPTPYFLDLVAFPAFVPQNEKMLADSTVVDARTGAVGTGSIWTRAGRIATNGPMLMTEWRFKRGMRFEKNPRYWDAGSIVLGSIDITTIEDPNAQVLAFRSGAVDWVSDVSPGYRGDMIALKEAYWKTHAERVAAAKKLGRNPIEIDAALPAHPDNFIHVLPSFGTYFYNFNCGSTLPDGRPNPFADSRVRRAFAMCIDKESLTRDVRRSGEPVALSLIPPGSIPGHRSPTGIVRNDVRAAELLAEAGFPKGEGFPEVELLFNKDGGHDLIAQTVAKDWERALGVRVRFVQKETKVFSSDLKAGRFMISRASWFGDYGDATTFLDINRTGNGNNDRRFSSPAFDAILDRAANETNSDARAVLLADAERLLVEDECPFLPLFHYVEVSLFDAASLQGIGAHPRQIQDLARLRLSAPVTGAKR